ncbi:MAG: helix-turn-helix transcriptional regulator [Clostridiaceae bacterium]|nr:helix-turn-helix transcriptional regulator [Eubacteriales bacterium]
MTFYERYAECCQQKGISPVSQTAADQIGCSKANISAFAKNGTTPKGEVVAGAARMLNVSADYLLGIIDAPHRIEMDDPLSPNERRAVNMLRGLNIEGQEAAIAMISGLASQAIYKKYSETPMDTQKQA